MKIAIVAPSGVPYAVGGAEKFWWGMLDAINQLTTHEVELIKIPSPERNFWEVLESYKRFSELDLDHFDCVISTKYPAWMVAHRNHCCYLQHTLRGLYDSYPADMQSVLDADAPDSLQPLLALLARSPARHYLSEVFDAIAQLRLLDKASTALLEPWCQLPGPLLRKIVHWLDAVGKHPTAIQRYFAISHTVTQRADYFPSDVLVTVLHHPSDLGNALTKVEGAYRDYLFTASRLDVPKRIDMIINAFKQVTADVELRIGGDGPELAALQAIAKDDKRIRFLGRVSDSELKKQYASALFVPFVPYDEDYGLITLEAMQAAKAVVTVEDSGGVNELVRHGENGLCVAPSETALAAAMQQLVGDKVLAKRMGHNARRSVSHIQWRTIVNALLAIAPPAASVTNTLGFSLNRRAAPFTSAISLPYDGRIDVDSGRSVHPVLATLAVSPSAAKLSSVRLSSIRQELLTIVVTVSFPVFPPSSGGQNRIYRLYREVAKQANVTLVTLCDAGQEAIDREIAPGLWERRVPKSKIHQRLEGQIGGQLGASVGDLVAMKHIEETGDYLRALREETEFADIVIASHHYLYPAIRYVYRGPLVYEAHNVEADMKRAVLQPGADADSDARAAADQWLAYNQSVEQACAQDAVLITTCSSGDVDRFKQLYRLDDKKFAIVPNGVDLDSVAYATPALRARYQRRQGLGAVPVAFFMGSWHGPNIEAVQSIMALAKSCPQWQFWVMGSVCDYYKKHKKHQITAGHNVVFLGMLAESEKAVVLASVDLALNPMSSGSGSNLKMMEYAAAGLPMLSTPFGNRGLCYQDGVSVTLREHDKFAEYLNSESWHNRHDSLVSGRSSLPQSVRGSVKASAKGTDKDSGQGPELAGQIASAYQLTRSTYQWSGLGADYAGRLKALFP